MSQDIIVQTTDGIATVTLNRPDQRNAISFAMWGELKHIATELEANSDVRVVVFTGAGDEAFSAGADIKDFKIFRKDAASAKNYSPASEGAMDLIEAMSKPTIALIKGYCVGGGCALATSADIRIATDSARLGIPAAKLSIAYGFQEMRRLVNVVGPAGARYILLTARLMDAQEALRIGLVSQVVPLAEIEEYTYRLAREMAALGPLSHRYNKAILRTVLENPALRDLTPEQATLPYQVFDSQDFQEGRRAFLEKRKARFEGR
ncbi:MAG: enoyl-CoA hydratase/isomerase family protein [Chloroflexi bacterium]|nr:enoyl-CoA hydratase/isomerase family protein [Chloroflexota bacterium]